MRFALEDSPFRNIHKYHDDDILDYLDPRLREFAGQYHEQKKAALPPCAFVFGDVQGSFVLGFSHSTPNSFIETVRYEARHLKGRRALLLSEVNSLSSPGKGALLAAEIQAPGSASMRCAYDLLGPGRMPISSDWILSALDPVEKERLDGLDPVVKMIEEASSASRLVGLSLFFLPIFLNPIDSAES